MGDSSDDVDIELERALALSGKRQYSEALAKLDDLILRHDERHKLYFHRAMVKKLARDVQGALSDITLAIECDETEPAPFFFRGQWSIEAGSYPSGIDDLGRAIAADEALGSSYYADSARFVRAVAYFLSGRFDEAQTACETVSVDAQTYLAGRLWRVKDLQRPDRPPRR